MKDYCNNMGGQHKIGLPSDTSIKHGSFNSGDTAKRGSGGEMSAKGLLAKADRFENTGVFPIGSKGTGDGLSKLANDKALTKNFPK